MIRRPPRSTLDRSSAASDVYKRQLIHCIRELNHTGNLRRYQTPVSYTHLRAHETPEQLVCRLLLEKKKTAAAGAVPSSAPRPAVTGAHGVGAGSTGGQA